MNVNDFVFIDILFVIVGTFSFVGKVKNYNKSYKEMFNGYLLFDYDE